ncbi:NAD(P)H-dependent nitrite reductase flavoprotein subunit [Filomicrobium insigne]|uniref:NAD(P)H-dependent nitrite reductase flavoprotein subunit n=1 Tax=Filomicrobium insigne TaxID=418854 RepID=A0A1H0I433_9HYPH|nr:sulfite reductase subunit alpha [Filomicrobium insigne]SDO26155.1 NAD(P)H-dependent nitrite reductase flavoprotein subunit [Filomicrobium insigne]
MSIQERTDAYQPGQVPVIPETAPFNPDQRAWLNGFFAGLLSLDAAGAAAVQFEGGLPGGPTPAAGDGDDGADPWHDPSMAIDERMTLADGRPLRRKLYAAMAQQDCGQCGYLCESYAEKVAVGEEARLNLCVPGGKETSRMLKRLMEEAPAAPISEPKFDVAVTTAPAVDLVPGYSREAPVTAIFRGTRCITGATSTKDTRHVVFDLTDSGIAYEPGDSFGVYATNDPALADAVLAAMNAPADFPIGDKTLRQSLIEDYDLGTAPDMLFELASYMVGGDRRRKAKALAKGDDPDGDAATFDVLKAVESLGPMHPDPEAFLECLEPLHPRLYSISSSPLATPGELHLTVDTVRYEIDGRQRVGVASTFLADRIAPGTPLKVYVQKTHGFGLPEDPNVPVIMVGPGTGIAPFRSFLWHRHASKAPGRSWLFFGHQHEASEFFYRDELDAFLATRVLSKLSTAWSRDGTEKVYVQDRMRENAAEVWAWLGEGAHFYVCGDAKRMAKDVETALIDIAGSQGGKSAEEAKEFVVNLKATGRYQADVY